MLKYQIADSEIRNGWCTGGDCKCAKYGCRPCCPPKVKLFNALKARKHMYLVFVKMVLEDYYTVYPNVRESKSWCYFGMDGTHKMTRNIQNKIAESFEGQAFRVGGCLGCQYPKTGKCKRYAPALEATGINVCALSLGEFGEEIVWREAKQPMEYMIAIGGIYTDEDISKDKFKEVIRNVTHKS
jgi:predicted metal-binding protein